MRERSPGSCVFEPGFFCRRSERKPRFGDCQHLYGDVEGRAEGAADFTTSSGQEDLRNAMLNDTAITVKFYLNDDTYLTGTAVITAFSLSISTEDKATVSISITGNGKLTLTKPGA